MNEHEIERIAAAMNQLRPDWPTRSLKTLLSGPKLADRPRRDVTVALAWVACESGTATPARVLEAGPWWRAATIEGNHNAHEPYDDTLFCAVCSEPRARCERKWAGDHQFEPAGAAKARRGMNVSPAVAALRSELHTSQEETA